ncbi:MAG: TlpA family protein disulfide reductase [Bacteroidia bacterium]|nr:TlpA family protein disulfide reductase [Bacteroidia bacterium]
MKKIIFFIFIFMGFTFFIFSQKKIKAYKIDQLVKRISNPDTIYVVNFWATWCKPCVAELPEFEKLNTDSAKTKIKVILVSMDFKEDLKTKLKPFLTKNKMKAEVLLLDETDATMFIPKLDERWSGAIPATLIVQGNKRSFAEKKLDYEKLVELIKSRKK